MASYAETRHLWAQGSLPANTKMGTHATVWNQKGSSGIRTLAWVINHRL